MAPAERAIFAPACTTVVAAEPNAERAGLVLRYATNSTFERVLVIVEGAGEEALDLLPVNAVLHTLAPGCPCCTASLPLTVTLTRGIRQHRPTHVLIVIIDPSHLQSLRDRLQRPPFAGYLDVGDGTTLLAEKA